MGWISGFFTCYNSDGVVPGELVLKWNYFNAAELTHLLKMRLYIMCIINKHYQAFFKYLLGATWPELLFLQKTFLVWMPTPQVGSPLQLGVALRAVPSTSSEQELQGDTSQKKCTHGCSLQARCSCRARSGGQPLPPAKGQENTTPSSHSVRQKEDEDCTTPSSSPPTPVKKKKSLNKAVDLYGCNNNLLKYCFLIKLALHKIVFQCIMETKTGKVYFWVTLSITPTHSQVNSI